MKSKIVEILNKSKKVGALLGSVMGVFLFLIGTYNTVSLNSVSYMQDNEIKFVKRLDELSNKVIAAKNSFNMDLINKYAARDIKKVPAKKAVKYITAPSSSNAQANSEPQEKQDTFAAVITQDLELDLVEVFNSKLFKAGLTPRDFSGKLMASNGVIESLEVELPNNQTIEVGYAEMAGNVFKYELDGTSYSGMMYEVKKGEYMVTLANGPYQGTRMKFSGIVEEVYPEEADRNVANNIQDELVDDYDKQFTSEADQYGNPGESYVQEAKVAPVQTDNGQEGFGYQFNSEGNVQ